MPIANAGISKREPLERFDRLLPERQGQNLALTVLYVPYSLDSGKGGDGTSDGALGQSASERRGDNLLPIPNTQHRTPYTLHPAPYTLHPTNFTPLLKPHNLHPFTLHPTPETLQPSPYTLHSAHRTSHHKTLTLHPISHTLHITPYNVHRTPYTTHPKPCI